MRINNPHTPPEAQITYGGDETDDEQELLSEENERPTLPPPPEWQERVEQSEGGSVDGGHSGRDCWYVAFGPLKAHQVQELLDRSPEEIAVHQCYLLNRARGTWRQRDDLDDLEPCGSGRQTAPPPSRFEIPPRLPSLSAEPVKPPPLPGGGSSQRPKVTPPPLPVESSPKAARKTPPPLPSNGPTTLPPEQKDSLELVPEVLEVEEETLETEKKVQDFGLERPRESNHEIRGLAFIDPASGVLRIDERESDRVTFKASVTVSSDCNFWTGIAIDISGGGLFVATYNTVPVGTRVSLDFSMPDDGPRIRAVGEVVWHRIFREDNELIPGMGVRFVHLSDQDKERIGVFVKNRETLLFEE